MRTIEQSPSPEWQVFIDACIGGKKDREREREELAYEAYEAALLEPRNGFERAKRKAKNDYGAAVHGFRAARDASLAAAWAEFNEARDKAEKARESVLRRK
jgi:hypothetical protein